MLEKETKSKKGRNYWVLVGFPVTCILGPRSIYTTSVGGENDTVPLKTHAKSLYQLLMLNTSLVRLTVSVKY